MSMADSMDHKKHLNIPSTLIVTGNESEKGLNGVYKIAGRFRNGKFQWMKPKTRCYIRWIRNRWELYVSHHPNGTTYFFNSAATDASEIPPQSSWQRTLCVGPSEVLSVVIGQEDDHDDKDDVGKNKNNLTVIPDSRIATGMQQDHHPKDVSRGMTQETNLVQTSLLIGDNISSVPAPLGHDDDGPSQKHVLYTNDTCPFAQQVHIAIQELGLENKIEYRKVDIFEKSDLKFVQYYREAYPSTKKRPSIPMLLVAAASSNNDNHHHAVTATKTDDSVNLMIPILESRVILEFLQEQHDTTTTTTRVASILPQSAQSRALIRMFLSIFQSELVPCLSKILHADSPTRLHQEIQAMLMACKCLQTVLMKSSKMIIMMKATTGDYDAVASPYLCGNHITMAEIVTAPFFQRLLFVVPKLRPEIIDCGHNITTMVDGKQNNHGGGENRSTSSSWESSLLSSSVLFCLMEKELPDLCTWLKATLNHDSVSKSFHYEKVTEIMAKGAPSFCNNNGKNDPHILSFQEARKKLLRFLPTTSIVPQN